MEIYGVITGVIVKSSSIDKSQRMSLLKTLKESVNEINTKFLREQKAPFEFYRGDSFQVKINQAHLALITAILLRAKIKSLTPIISLKGGSFKNSWDARISIGIGGIDYSADKIIESDGDAYKYSGIMLDKIKDTTQRLIILTPWPEINAELEVETAMVDMVISHWTVQQANAVYLYLLKNENQVTLAKQLSISQPALRKRLFVSGKIGIILLFIKRFENLIQNKI